MKLSDQKTYFEAAATNNLAIGHSESSRHFYVYSAEDALTNLKDIESPMMGLEVPEVSFKDNLADNIRVETRGAVLILKKVQMGNHSEVTEAMIEMYDLAIQIMTKIYNDRKKANDSGVPSPQNLLKHLDLNNFNLVEVGPVFNSWYGWRINTMFNGPINLTLDESQWKPNTEKAWQF